MNAFEAAKSALAALRGRGFEAWLVGGAVRDHLLGKDPAAIAEFDVVTSASPEEVMSLFRSTVAVGRAFGVVRVRIKGFWFEIATYRTLDSGGTRPQGSLAGDAACRDFTMNALFWDPGSGRIEDPMGGRADLDRRLVRAVGDPDRRFGEDALRVLRAVRFGAWSGFRIEPGTLEAAARHAPRLGEVSAERLRDELSKIAVRPEVGRGAAWRLLVSTGIARVVLPAARAEAGGETEALVLDALQRRTLPLFLAVVLRRALGPGTPPKAWRELAERVVRDLKGPVDEAERLGDLLAGRARYRDLRRLSAVRRRLAATRAGREDHEDLLAAEGDAAEILALLDEERRLRGPAREDPLLDGKVLMAAGMKPGPGLGRILRKVRVLQLGGRLKDRADALRWLGRAGNRRADAPPPPHPPGR